MATKSTIEWTGLTWNPTIGCSEQSPGCTNCYAAKMAYRLMHIPAMAKDYEGLTIRLANGRIVWTGKVTALDKRLIEPLEIKKPSTFFVNSMSDLFHPEVPFKFIDQVFEVMAKCPHHTIQILIKQSKRALEYFNQQDNIYSKWTIDEPNKPLKNVWIGVSLENDKYIHHVDDLIKIPAAIRFISLHR